MLRPDLILRGYYTETFLKAASAERSITWQNEKRHKEKMGMPAEEKCKNSPTVLV